MSSAKSKRPNPVPLMLVIGAAALFAVSRVSSNTPRAGGTDDGNVLHVGDAEFSDAVLEAPGPVLVDFYADWCGPCRQLAPTLKRVADDAAPGQVVKVDVDASPQLAAQYQIEGIPTLLVFVDGEVTTRLTGVQSEQRIRSLLKSDG